MEHHRMDMNSKYEKYVYITCNPAIPIRLINLSNFPFLRRIFINLCKLACYSFVF